MGPQSLLRLLSWGLQSYPQWVLLTVYVAGTIHPTNPNISVHTSSRRLHLHLWLKGLLLAAGARSAQSSV